MVLYPTSTMLQREGYLRFGTGALSEPYARCVAAWLQEQGHAAYLVLEVEHLPDFWYAIYWKENGLTGIDGYSGIGDKRWVETWLF